jgi:hypothetical protein
MESVFGGLWLCPLPLPCLVKKGVVEEEILHWISPPLATALPDPELGRGGEEDESTTSTSSPPAAKRE